jgi:hypothetical protein
MLGDVGKVIGMLSLLKPLAVGSKLSGCDWLGPVLYGN